MNRANVETWLAALRSGQYSQAKEVLHDQDNGGYCCLGVGTHCMDPAHPYLREEQGLPDRELFEWLGLTASQIQLDEYDSSDVESDNSHFTWDLMIPRTAIPESLNHLIRGYEQAIQVSRLNDNGVPFEEIADILEATLL